VTPATHRVRQFTQRRQIVSCVKRHTIFKRETLAGTRAFGNLVEFIVV
jgi:hypothetical protein